MHYLSRPVAYLLEPVLEYDGTPLFTTRDTRGEKVRIPARFSNHHGSERLNEHGAAGADLTDPFSFIYTIGSPRGPTPCEGQIRKHCAYVRE
jgi:hypothetical protein